MSDELPTGEPVIHCRADIPDEQWQAFIERVPVVSDELWAAYLGLGHP